MTQTIFATKKNMAQVWTKSGKRFPVTVISPLQATVTQIKTTKKDGYTALQIAIGQRKSKLINKPTKGHLKNSNKELNPRHIKEIKFNSDDQLQDFQLGQQIDPFQTLNSGDQVKVSGTTKGKGFAGVMKRHNFAGGPRTHGQSDRERAPGSIGQGTTPGRVWKGKKMAGHMGNQTHTVKNLVIVHSDTTNQEIWIKGSIPGHFGSLITINKTGEAKFEGLVNAQTDTLPEETPTQEPQLETKPEEATQTQPEVTPETPTDPESAKSEN